MPGSSASFSEKMKSAIRPSQNTGAQTPNSANPIAVRSTHECRLSAARTPSGIPMSSQRIAAPMISASETGARAFTSSSTGDLVLNDSPRPGQPYWSPRKSRLT